MGNLRDIRRRLRSVAGTAKITRAMQMVAAVRMRRAQQMAVMGRPYASLMGRVLSEACQDKTRLRHPLMERREGGMQAIVVLATDKGLCGPLNSALGREILTFDATTTGFIVLGRKGAQLVTRTRRRLLGEFNWRDENLMALARIISHFASGLFLDGDLDRVDVLYTHYVSTLVQRPQVRPFLPLGERPFLAFGRDGTDATGLETAPAEDAGEKFHLEPSVEAVFEPLLIESLDFQMYQMLLEARASEYSARMVAMKNATDNAQSLLADLTLEYNQLRQAAITRELLEISAARATG